MKKITLFILFILTLNFNSYSQSPCDYSVTLNDSYGDGWNGASINILVNNVVTLSEITVATDFDATFSIPNVADGAVITSEIVSLGSFPGEITWDIKNNIGTIVDSGDGSPQINVNIAVACQAAIVPPTNISSSTATLINCGETLLTNSLGSTATPEDSGCTMSDLGVWYTFVGTGLDVTVTSTASFDQELAIASGTPGALVNEVCVDNGFTSETATIATTLGTIYYVYTAHWGTSNSTGEISVNLECATCNAATISYAVVNDCDNSGGFSIDVTVDDLGSATALTLTNDQNAQSFPVTSAGTTVQFGPFVSATDVVITTDDDNDDDTCTVVSSALTQTCPPANDLPGGAITLTLDEGSACGANTIVGISNEGTTDSAGAAVPSCGSYGTPTDRGDLWYVFTAPNTTVTLNTTNLAGFTSIAGTYYTGTPGSLVEADCTEFGSGWPWELTGLTVSETYYLRIWDYGNNEFGTFDLCGYYVSCTAGEATAEVTNNCDTTGDAFGVVVTFSAENDAVGVSDGTTTFPISGGVATTGPYAFGAPVTLNVVHSDMACDFELGTYQVDACPPSNDNCDNPIAITLNADETCTVVTAGTTVNATASSQANDVSGLPNNDVWFSFVATSVSHTISLENRTNVGGGTSTSTDMGMGLYELTSDCDNLVFSSTSDPESYTATGLTIGSTYLLRVYGWFSSIQNVTFDVCVQTSPPPPPAPANDACSSATVVDTLPFTSSADASSATNNDGSVTSCSFGMNDGVWYTFTPTASGTLDLSVDVTGWDHEIAVYTGSCGVFTCVDSADSGGTGGTESLSISVTAGTQYWLNIGHYSSTDNSEGAYTFNSTSSDGVSLVLDYMEISQFTYYPNPVNNILTLDAQKNIESVVAYNMLGQEVLRLSPNTVNAEVDMSSLLSGAYFVKVSIQGATKTVRIIKQ